MIVILGRMGQGMLIECMEVVGAVVRIGWSWIGRFIPRGLCVVFGIVVSSQLAGALFISSMLSNNEFRGYV